jgi:hypothetical protein
LAQQSKIHNYLSFVKVLDATLGVNRRINGFCFCIVSSDDRNKKQQSTLDTTITKSVIILITLMKQQTTTTYEMKRLKIKCSVHPNFSKIPPQEHGMNQNSKSK